MLEGSSFIFHLHLFNFTEILSGEYHSLHCEDLETGSERLINVPKVTQLGFELMTICS